MLSKEQYSKILEELDDCQRPLYFFHDDADGLSSFLLLYRYKNEGKGVCVKSQPKVDNRFFNVVREYAPDKIFILDLAILDEDFADEFRNIPIIWIDHHMPMKIHGVKYFNPRVENIDDSPCASYLCYNVIKDARPEDIWIAAAGTVGDWQLNEVTRQFAKEHPDLLPESVTRPEVALFDTPFSKLVKIFNFMLKGKTQEVMRSVKTLTRVESPYELLNKDTPRAKFILKRYDEINDLYEELLEFAVKKVSKSQLLMVQYAEVKMSFSSELSNELLYRYPDKIILVAREKSGEMKCSLRTSPGINLQEALKKALEGVEGYGGGHKFACGACVKVDDFEQFVDQLKKAVKKPQKVDSQ
ncbi:MAG: DHH family phosphoesterase [Candidatus Woesearchaeota archaeon]